MDTPRPSLAPAANPPTETTRAGTRGIVNLAWMREACANDACADVLAEHVTCQGWMHLYEIEGMAATVDRIVFGHLGKHSKPG